MADIIICTKDELQPVADAIREKTGETESITIAEMPAKIRSITSGGSDSDLLIAEEASF